MAEFILTLSDTVPIKTGFSSPATVQMPVSDIVNFGINNNLGNAFMLIDAGNTRAGLAIRYFKINGDTAYLATTSYINENNYIGIGESANIVTQNNSGYYCNNPWASPYGLGPMGVAFNFGTKTINNIIYDVQGGNVSGYASAQAIYIPDTVTNIYIDGSPLVSYVWSSVPAISGKNGILSLAMINDADIGDGSPVTDAPASVISQLTAGLRDILSNATAGQEVEIIRSGEVYKLTGTKAALGVAVSLKFYLAPTTPGAQPSAFYTVNVAMRGLPVGAPYLGFIIDDENEVAALNIIRPHLSGVDNVVDYCEPGTGMSAENMHLMYLWIKGSALPENWDNTDGLTDDDGNGGGNENPDIDNPIPIPDIPYLSAYDTGFLTQYLVSKGELKSLSDFLWSDSFVSNVKKFFNDPRQIIMGITIFPLTPTHASSSSEIVAGGISTGVNGYKVSKQFERYDFGECSIPRSFDNGIFYDYEPYTDAKIYIPYCGEHALPLSDIMGKTLHLWYTVDHVSGVCCAHLVVKDDKESCHYNFTGQMGVQVPISSEDFGGFYRSIIAAGAVTGAAIATTASGGLTAPALGAGFGAENVAEFGGLSLGKAALPLAMGGSVMAQNVANMGRDISFTSGGGSISGALSSNYPYVTLTRPNIFEEGNQRHYTGYPVYGTHKLKDCSGYTKVMGIHLDGLTCTEEERKAIRTLLSAGVVIRSGDTVPDRTAPAGDFSIVFLKNLSDVDTIGKKFEKDNQGHVIALELGGKIIYSQDLASMELLIDANISAYNYVYIREFGRFYYIDKIVAESGTMFRVSLSCDAAQSFWNELKECEAMIEFNESETKAKYLINNSTWFMQQNKKVRTYVFKGTGETDFDNAKYFDRGSTGSERFLITIAGG